MDTRESRGHAKRFVLGRRELLVGLLLFLCSMTVYNANRRSISAGDTYPARYLPFVIWHYHSLGLDPLESVVAQGRASSAFWIVRGPDGRAVSLYPVVVPTLVAPLYLPAVAYLNMRGWTDARLDHVARIMEKFSASLIAAGSVALLYLLLRRRTSERVAILLTVAYAFGTTTWVISSQALWQHGMGQLLLIACLLILTGPCTVVRALAAGLLLGLLAGNRPPDALLAAALGVYGLFWARGRALLLAAGAALPMGLVLFYNLQMTGNIAGGYGLRGNPSFLQHDLFYGIAGILFSPMRGLFIFSPFLLFLVLMGPHLRRDRSERGLTLAMLASVVLQIVLYAKADWRSGISWGPRYMTDLLPMLIWMLVPVVASLRRFGRVCFMVAVVVAVMIEGIGAFCYTGATDLPLYEIVEGPGKMRPAWEWRNAPFIASLRYTITPVRGSFDGIQTGTYNVNATNVGDEVDAVGWALFGDRTPFQVAIKIDGEGRSFATRSFFDRSDLRETLHEANPAGWRIPINTAGLAPGEHRLTAFAWVSESGERRFVGERYLILTPAVAVTAVTGDLEASAKSALARLREHQQAAGYWLTLYTKGAQFEDPKQELNSFLTAFVIDLLEPMGSSGRLGNSLQRAREYLSDQIEANGLVRYHGVPNAPGIGTLGCVITPDADDTALVWRLAPGDVRLLSTALATLKQYRTDNGLYRTWLAPKDAYQCIDPGRDPNPTDIAIQMHVMLLLAKTEPPAARALCKAMRPVVNEDRVWVYYSMAPLVPLVRLKDLQEAGCELELPESRTRTSVADQAPWVNVASLLGGASRAKDLSTVEIETVLRQIANNDFSLVRRNPPLLYHNDLTASVRRYYWSEDAGYALWLRLYYEHERVLASHVGR
jgi:hypothetical protein